jgi:hypothetical protein
VNITVLENLGNMLGKFIMLGPFFKSIIYRIVVNVLMEIDKNEGLLESVDLETGNEVHTQELEYRNIFVV